ncbi:MAG: OmpA family protein [Rhodobacteraceae bacterium]|nr:OmpA family protein [Paracoccaceae bacterium]
MWDSITIDRHEPEEARAVKSSVFRSMLNRRACVLAVCGMASTQVCAAELALVFPAPSVVTAARDVGLSSYALPLGPFRDGAIKAVQTEGPMLQEAWQVESDSLSTLELMQGLRAQILAAGYAPLFECETQACGGFDFRYGTEVLPEPEMHVDLGDFRFLAASRDGAVGTEYLSLLVSRSPLNGYVQMTRVGGSVPAPALTASTKTPGAVAAPAVVQTDGAVGEGLATGLPVVLQDLVFASGAATLEDADYPSLVALAAWLQANPAAKVMLVGHTDAVGGLAANTSLSKRRAESVREVLIARHGIPAAQVSADGVGPLAPRGSNLDAAGQAQNRRVEVFVTSTQ